MKWTLVEAAGFLLAVAALPFFVVAGWSVSWQLGICLIGVSLLVVATGLIVLANMQTASAVPSAES